MSINFPTPIAPYQVYRYDNKTFVWDGIAWYIDRFAGGLARTLTPAVTATLAYPLAPGQTTINLLDADLYGNSYTLATTPPLEPLIYSLNGVELLQDDGSGLLGDWTVDYAANTVTLLQPPPRSALAMIRILLPPERAAVAGFVNAFSLLDLDTDWSDPGHPTGLKDGVNLDFPLYYLSAGTPTPAAVTDPVQVEIFLDGVRQRPGFDYDATGAVLSMTTPPRADSGFWGIYLAPAPLP